MRNKRNLRELFFLSGVGFICLLLLAGGAVFGLHKRRVDLQNELGEAVDRGRSARVRELLEAGVEPNKPHDSPNLLQAAVIYCDPATVQLLIEKGADVNRANRDPKTGAGLTALHYAVIHRRCDMVEVLLRNGADARLKNRNGETALQSMKHKAHRFARHDNDAGIVLLSKQAEAKARKK